MSLDLFYSRAGHLIRRLNQISVAIFLEETAEFGLTSVQYAALNIIERKPGVDQVTLSRMIAFDKTTLVKVLQRLVEKGLVTRKVSAADRRRLELRATARGREIIRRIIPMIDRSEQRILAPLAPEDQRKFLELASRLVQVNNVYSRAPMKFDLIEALKDKDSSNKSRRSRALNSKSTNANSLARFNSRRT